MKTLAKQIERELKASAWGHCAIYEDDLQRIWPIEEENRKAKIAQFAREYGFRLRFYGKGMGALFEKWPQQRARIQGGESGRRAITSTGPRAFYEETKDKPLVLSSHHGCSLEK